MINLVKIQPEAKKNLRKIPAPLVERFLAWVRAVNKRGLMEVRKCSGYHDEPLKGKWRGYRSIRLNRAYRAFYRIEKETITFVVVERVNKHEY